MSEVRKDIILVNLELIMSIPFLGIWIWRLGIWIFPESRSI
jgi:hypothetical protein